MKTVLLTCLCKEFDEKLAAAFVREGFCVFSIGNKPVEGVTLLPFNAKDAAAAFRENVGKLPRDVGKLPGDVGNLPRDVGKLPGDVGKLPGGVGKLPGGVGKLPGGVGKLPGDVGKLPGDVGKLPGDVGLDFFLDTTDFCDPKDDFTARDGIDGEVVERVFRQNALRAMALLEAFLPLLDAGEGKRLFYLTSASSSINETRRASHFGYNMSKAALHQFIQMTRNKLFSSGYTFRVFDPLDGELPPLAAAESAFNYITRRRGTERDDPLRDDEDNLVFRDALGRQHAW